MVLDPHLGNHLAHWGINLMQVGAAVPAWSCLCCPNLACWATHLHTQTQNVPTNPPPPFSDAHDCTCEHTPRPCSDLSHADYAHTPQMAKTERSIAELELERPACMAPPLLHTFNCTHKHIPACAQMEKAEQPMAELELEPSVHGTAPSLTHDCARAHTHCRWRRRRSRWRSWSWRPA